MAQPLPSYAEAQFSPRVPVPGIMSPGRNATFQPVRSVQAQPRVYKFNDYFRGPVDLKHHSKWPQPLQLHGSVLPKLIVPLFIVGCWATAVTVVSDMKYDLGVDQVMLTVLGFVVGLSLSFYSGAAHTRYNEGRALWSKLHLTSRNVSRLLWFHVRERHDESPELGRQDLLAKVSAINLVSAYAIALKHHLRFEPSVEHPDLKHLIGHLDTFAGRADQSLLQVKPPGTVRRFLLYLGIPFARQNPRLVLKRTPDNVGNLPLEILGYLTTYIESLIQAKQFPSMGMQNQALTQINSLTEILTNCEKILNSPIPRAYKISISQVTWLYILLLPFQLYKKLYWITVPACLAAAYIILGMHAIGREIENPFGHEVNDLPLDALCNELTADLDLLMSNPPPKVENWIDNANNKVLWPLSNTNYEEWTLRDTESIRNALRVKAHAPALGGPGNTKKSRQQPREILEV